jgi:hypothetical protein
MRWRPGLWAVPALAFVVTLVAVAAARLDSAALPLVLGVLGGVCTSFSLGLAVAIWLLRPPPGAQPAHRAPPPAAPAPPAQVILVPAAAHTPLARPAGTFPQPRPAEPGQPLTIIGGADDTT